MARLLLFVLLTLFVFNAQAKKSNKVTNSYKYSQFTIEQRKKKLILSCMPLKMRLAGDIKWISECNNIAFNLLTQEKYQKILVEKEIEDDPFGRLSYQRASEATGSHMKRMSIRKGFKIKTN